jgi:hydrogenase nickel incorporation protein HypA/HybF
MHESGLSEAIVDAAVRRAAGRPISSLRVRVDGHPLDVDVVRTGFEIAALGTPVEGAWLDLFVSPMTVRCQQCHHTGLVVDHLALIACVRCGGLDIEVNGSEGVVLEHITFQAETTVTRGD